PALACRARRAPGLRALPARPPPATHRSSGALVEPALASQERHRALAALVDRIVAEVEPLHLQHNEAVWKANVTGDPAHEAESARLDAEIRKIFARREPFHVLSEGLKAGGVPAHMLHPQLV